MLRNFWMRWVYGLCWSMFSLVLFASLYIYICFGRLTNILEFVQILTYTRKITNNGHHTGWIHIQVKMVAVMKFNWNVLSITMISTRDDKKRELDKWLIKMSFWAHVVFCPFILRYLFLMLLGLFTVGVLLLGV